MNGKSQISSIMVVVGLTCLWVGERIVSRGTAEYVASGFGMALLVAALVLRGLRVKQAGARHDVNRVERTLLLLHGLAIVAVLLGLVTSDLFAKVNDTSLETNWPKLAGVLSVLWPALLAAAMIPTLLVELSYHAMARAPKLEVPRVHEALLAGLGLAFALTFAFATQYVVTEHDVKKDFSHFRTARPGEVTKKLVQSFDEKIEAVLFFPPASDVGELVTAFFDELTADAPMLTVTHLDWALEPMKSKELGVTSNGAVVIRKGARKEVLMVGTEVEKSRTQLRGLDLEVQKRLLQVGKTRRTVYLTAGHGERTQDTLSGADQRGTIELLQRTLQEQNFEVKKLSSAEGLGADIPRDAAAVFIIGPQQAFAEPEAKALEAFEKRGGKLFIALDPEVGLDFDELTKPLGLSFKHDVLTNDVSYARLRPTQTSADRRNLVTNGFSSHPSVTNLSRAGDVVLLMGAGAVDELPAHEAALSVDIAMKALPTTWGDTNQNFEADVPKETRKAYGLLAAVKNRGTSNKIEDEMRVLVLGDSDALSDLVLGSVRGNQLLVVDGLKWLLGDEQLQGTTNSEQDVAMTRTKEQDSALFYGTTLLAPLAVVGVGVLARRRKPTKKAEVAS